MDKDSSEEEVNVADMALPKNMKVVVESSDESDEEDTKGFLANTFSLIKEKDAANGNVKKSSKIANDLDALFSKHV